VVEIPQCNCLIRNYKKYLINKGMKVPSMPYSITVVFQCQSWYNIHGLQFLEQQFASIWYGDG
jgi:hypothetical protein